MGLVIALIAHTKARNRAVAEYFLSIYLLPIGCAVAGVRLGLQAGDRPLVCVCVGWDGAEVPVLCIRKRFLPPFLCRCNQMQRQWRCGVGRRGSCRILRRPQVKVQMEHLQALL